LEIFIGVIIFIMGTFFGSFFTLAVYRIPLKKDITHEHSFCPNCNHKLGAFDLIPVWSYLLLGGRCRYCGEKIRIRYFLLEILSGLVFLAVYIGMKGNVYQVDNLEFAVSFVVQYITLVLISGIDKEYKKIDTSVLVFGGICQILYMLYLYIVRDFNMYRYIIYFIVFIILLIFSNTKSQFYQLQLLSLIAYILFAIGEKALIPIISTFVILEIVSIVRNCKKISLPCGYILGLSTICYKIVDNFILNYYFN